MRGRTNLPQDIVTEPGGSDVIEDLNLSWKEWIIPTTSTLQKVIYAMDMFLAIGNDGTLAYSNNGKQWLIKEIDAGAVLLDMVYANGQIVILGYKWAEDGSDIYGVIFVSNDTENWAEYSYQYQGKSVIYEKILWDGARWVITCIGHQKTNYIYLLAMETINFGNVIFHEISNSFNSAGNYIGYHNAFYTNMVYGNYRYVAVSMVPDTSDYFYVSSNLITWEKVRTPSEIRWISHFDFINGMFFASGRMSGSYNELMVHTSLTGNIWTSYKHNERADAAYPLYLNQNYILVSNNGRMQIFKDFTSFQSTNFTTITTVMSIRSLANNESVIVAVGTNGIVLTADLVVSDNTLSVIPMKQEQKIYIRKKDNIRVVNIRAVDNSIDSNIRPENIKAGTTILGVTGILN